MLKYSGAEYTEVLFKDSKNINDAISPAYYLAETNDLAIEFSDSTEFRLEKDKYFVCKNDSIKAPIIIYKKNDSVVGSHGWFYIRNDFDFILPNVNSHQIVEVFADWNPRTWDTTDAQVINEIKTAITKKANLIPIIDNYAGNSWSILYIRYDNSPFVQRIGWKENGEFVYEDYIPDLSTTQGDHNTVETQGDGLGKDRGRS